MTRLAVPKTYKLYIGGKFPRSESGRTYEIDSARRATSSRTSRRRRARTPATRSSAARGALKGWAGATAYNRGQVLYRIAELLEGPPGAVRGRDHPTRGGQRGRGIRPGRRGDRPLGLVRGLDRQARAGHRQRATRSPVRTSTSRCPSPPASSPSIAPQDSSLLGFVSAVAPPLVTGNTVVVVASERLPLSAISLAEVLATSDVPGGVVNILTGSPAEIAPWLASHADVNALDLVGAGRPRLGRSADRGGRHAQARAAARRGSGCRGPEPRPHQRVHRDEDGLAHQEHGLNPRDCANFGNETVTGHVGWTHTSTTTCVPPEDMPDARRPSWSTPCPRSIPGAADRLRARRRESHHRLRRRDTCPRERDRAARRDHGPPARRRSSRVTAAGAPPRPRTRCRRSPRRWLPASTTSRSMSRSPPTAIRCSCTTPRSTAPPTATVGWRR